MNNLSSSFEIRGKTIAVTGGSRGIGKIIALALAGAGAEVILISKNPKRLEGTQKELQGQTKARVSFIAADVADFGQTRTAFNGLDKLDVLINCAGVLGPVGPFENNDMDAWAETIRVNLLGTVHCCKAALPLLRRSKWRGKIINISGGGSAYARKFHTAYGTSKTAVVRFTETLAEELKGGVDANIVAPGAHNTDMWRGETFDKPPDTWAEPERLKALIMFLVSEKSDGLTGKFIHIYDEWERFNDGLSDSPLYTLRRTEP